jgi:transposase InsO family protein
LGHDVGRGTIATILRQHGIQPAPERQKRTTWQEFLKARWDVLAAADFFSVEVWTAMGLTRYTVLFVIELATRRVHIAGISAEPDSAWVTQCSRQLTDAVDGFLLGKRFLLHDRDPLFSEAFRETLAATGVETVRLPPCSPNLNAYAERYVRTIKEACLNRMIFVGERSLRRAIAEFVTHYHQERNHQDLSNVLILPCGVQPQGQDRLVCRERLGGLFEVLLPQAGGVGTTEPKPEANYESIAIHKRYSAADSVQ